MSDAMLKGIMEALGYIESAVRELNGTLIRIENQPRQAILDLAARLDTIEEKVAHARGEIVLSDPQPKPNRDEELVEKWTIAIYNEYWEQNNTMSTDKLGWLKPIIRAIIKEAREG